MMNQWNSSVLAGVLVGGLVGCEGLKKSLEDALDDGPKDSYCDALCDWAVECADGISDLSRSEMVERCDEATHATDSRCKEAEAGGMAIPDALVLSECTEAIADMNCDGLTGSESDVLTGAPPMGCAPYALDAPEVSLTTYNDARNAVMQTGSELCDGVADEICGSMVDCLMGDHGIEEAEDFLMEQCTDTAWGPFRDRCRETGLYDQTLPLDYNPNRYLVEKCIEGFAEADACSPTSWPVECAGAFTPIDGESLYDLAFEGATGFLTDFIPG